MRRKWELRLWRGWRDARLLRPAATRDRVSRPLEIQRKQLRVLIGVCLLLALALWAILTLRPLTNPNFQVGEPSPVDVRAPRTVTFASTLLTEQERIRVESSPDAVVYTRVSTIPIEQRNHLADALQTITRLRSDPTFSNAEKQEKLVSLPLPTSTLVISPQLALQIIRMSEADWAMVDVQALAVYDRAMSAYDYELNDADVRTLRERSMPYWGSLVARGAAQQLIVLFSSAFIQPNQLLDDAATRARKQSLRDQVKPVMVSVQEGENIIHAGDIVTPAVREKLGALGLLDADIYGPSIPLMLGTKGQTPAATAGSDGQARMLPIEAHGIKMISVGFLVDDSQPVIWRGPMVSQLLRQFLYQVDWGELDYLIIDMPPGTGDIALTLAQSLQNVGLTGAVTVTTPQQVATIDVLKSMEMFKKVNVPLLGVIENMAYFVAPDTGARYDIFGTGGAARLAEQLGVPLLGQIPLGMSVRAGGDTGEPAATSTQADAYAAVFREIAQQLAARVSVMEYA